MVREAKPGGGRLGESVLSVRQSVSGGPDAKVLDREQLFADAGLRYGVDGDLRVGEVPVEEIARETGTPAFVYHAAPIRDRYRRLDAAFSAIPHGILYAVKANANLAVLRLFRDLGAGCDIVSAGELERALRAGFDPRRLVFSGVGKTPAELEAACRAGIGQINVESEEELGVLEGLASAGDRPIRVGIRVNPKVTVDTHPFISTGTAAAKFGIPLDRVLEVAQRILPHPRLRLTGLAMHVGSQLLDVAPYETGARRLAELGLACRRAGATDLESLDLGGGLGIRYLHEVPLEPTRLAEAILPILRSSGFALWLEPGRFLVGGAGLLLTTVLYRKHSGGKDFLVVDAGMSELVRPSHYLAYHDIVVTRRRGRPERVVDVVGPICESGDFLALDRPLPEAEPGDVLAVLGAGAYGFVMGSTYNGRPRPPEILVDGSRWAVARARETLDDLMRGETVDPLTATDE